MKAVYTKTAFNTKAIGTAEQLLASYTATVAIVVEIFVEINGMVAGAGKTCTVRVEKTSSAPATIGANVDTWAYPRYDANVTTFCRRTSTKIPMTAGEIVNVYAVSDFTSDTNCAGNVYFIDANAANLLKIFGGILSESGTDYLASRFIAAFNQASGNPKMELVSAYDASKTAAQAGDNMVASNMITDYAKPGDNMVASNMITDYAKPGDSMVSSNMITKENIRAEIEKEGGLLDSVVTSVATLATQDTVNILLGVYGDTEFNYTVTDNNGNPLSGVHVRATADLAGAVVTGVGITNALGVCLNAYGNPMRLPAGTVYLWRSKAGYVFNDPDTETN